MKKKIRIKVLKSTIFELEQSFKYIFGVAENFLSPGLNEGLWANFCDSDDTVKTPPSCGCHDLPRGSCPTVKTEFVQHISENLHSFGLTPNMDGLKKPLKNPSFSIDAWKKALGQYFDT